MSIRHSAWAHGIPSWVDLTTGDVEAAWRFYSAILGWGPPTASDLQSDYAVVRTGAAAVGGITRQQGGAPAGWTVYLAADDAEASAAVAVAQGATLVVPPADVSGGDGETLGRRAVLSDPLGARIGLWQAGSLIGLQLVNEPGGLCFEELRSPDPTASGRFYQSLFGYVLEPDLPYGPDYSVFRRSDEQFPLGGIRADDPAGQVESGWLPFFGIVDADSAGQQAVDNGGSVILPAFTTPNERVALLADPAGCPFWVVTSTGEAQPDRSG